MARTLLPLVVWCAVLPVANPIPPPQDPFTRELVDLASHQVDNFLQFATGLPQPLPLTVYHVQLISTATTGIVPRTTRPRDTACATGTGRPTTEMRAAMNRPIRILLSSASKSLIFPPVQLGPRAK
ncbi:hypothetical protein BJ742DRAFT_782343 [Cladochytrium replicatum]|nr:hypothetical protein BJ742DRAFT_782343 [Cladochytrium replicatum]